MPIGTTTTVAVSGATAASTRKTIPGTPSASRVRRPAGWSDMAFAPPRVDPGARLSRWIIWRQAAHRTWGAPRGAPVRGGARARPRRHARSHPPLRRAGGRGQPRPGAPSLRQPRRAHPRGGPRPRRPLAGEHPAGVGHGPARGPRRGDHPHGHRRAEPARGRLRARPRGAAPPGARARRPRALRPLPRRDAPRAARIGLADDEPLVRLVFAALDGLVIQLLVFGRVDEADAAIARLHELLADRLPPEAR